ncbi:MAG: NAD(P)/FAD-dependent oxidoreductase [Pseudomonadota bacterium]
MTDIISPKNHNFESNHDDFQSSSQASNNNPKALLQAIDDQYDVAIIGAGPVGLFAVFQLGLLGLKAVVFDVLDKAGGQCIELYPEKPIYDIPALVSVSGQELSDRLLQQIAPFDAKFMLNCKVETLSPDENGRFLVSTNRQQSFSVSSVFIATGSGVFAPRKPKIAEIADYEEKTFFYNVAKRDLFKDSKLVIFGGGDSAVDWTLNLSETAKHVTLVHRREQFKAQPASLNRLWDEVEAGHISFVKGELSSLKGTNGYLQSVEIKTKSDEENTYQHIKADYALAFFGLNIELGPLANWDIDLDTQHRILVDSEKFQTSKKGIFAIGDANYYPGKLKLILSGFHEAALAAQEAFKLAHPDEKLRFQYTTSSTQLQKRLKVA